jgi:hypothetical protein
VAIDLFERDVRLRLPFRFGVVTLTACPQAFVRVRIGTPDGRAAEGAAAELLAPKWFDKNLALSNEDNFDQLRLALFLARDLYMAEAVPATAFGRFARHYGAQNAAGADHGLNQLIAAYGPALIDRAVLDALCRMTDVPFYEAVRDNLVGLTTELTPDLAGFALDRFVHALPRPTTIAARHTVGLVDPITAADQAPGARVEDGLPETLEEVITIYGHTWFKLKVSGNVEADLDRLQAITAVLDRSPRPYRASLDGNEQYDDAEAVIALWRRMRETPRLRRLIESIAFIEQPIQRKSVFAHDVRALARLKPVIIDESDDDLDAFPRARALGYAGISSKTCKGFYKSILNAARVAKWNGEGAQTFMSGEDLTTQAGLSVQQDLALVSLIGLAHVERNGHHYVNGMASAPAAEQQAFLDAHPDLYVRAHGAVRLRIASGQLALGSLGCPGFATGAHPDWAAMRAMTRPRSIPAR